jgi:hypothetical protein
MAPTALEHEDGNQEAWRQLEGNSVIDAEELRRLLHYDPMTGVFTRKVCRNYRHPVGAAAGTVGKHGYVAITLDKRIYKAHRLAWLYVHGEWPTHDIDHINRKKADNRLANLRVATRSENVMNSVTARPANRAGLLGVRKDKYGFIARLRAHGVEHYLGSFRTAEEASHAYWEAKNKFVNVVHNTGA